MRSSILSKQVVFFGKNEQTDSSIRLPDEVWAIVVKFLPHYEDVLNLIKTNHFFHHQRFNFLTARKEMIPKMMLTQFTEESLHSQLLAHEKEMIQIKSHYASLIGEDDSLAKIIRELPKSAVDICEMFSDQTPIVNGMGISLNDQLAENSAIRGSAKNMIYVVHVIALRLQTQTNDESEAKSNFLILTGGGSVYGKAENYFICRPGYPALGVDFCIDLSNPTNKTRLLSYLTGETLPMLQRDASTQEVIEVEGTKTSLATPSKPKLTPK